MLTRWAKMDISRTIISKELLVFMWAVFLFVALSMAANPTVVTSLGPVTGFNEPESNVNVFLGIPFAAAPVGALRWMPPAPGTPWAEPRDATQWGSICPQVIQDRSAYTFPADAPVDEDCLQVNVFTPAAAASNASLPVFVWFHGGGFHEGSAMELELNGTNLASLGNVVVTVNYRLGALGFLYHESLDSGNVNFIQPKVNKSKSYP